MIVKETWRTKFDVIWNDAGMQQTKAYFHCRPISSPKAVLYLSCTERVLSILIDHFACSHSKYFCQFRVLLPVLESLHGFPSHLGISVRNLFWVLMSSTLEILMVLVYGSFV